MPIPRMLVFWDANGDVRPATVDHMVVLDDERKVIGLVDIEAHELAGGRMRDIADNSKAVGSGTWPEWIDVRKHRFRVELDPNPSPARARIKALVHKKSGHRRVRADIEAAIAERINEKKQEARKRGDEQRQRLKARGMRAEMLEHFADPPPEPADLRDLLGGPGKPLLLDENGRTKPRIQKSRPVLPVVKRGR